LNDSSYVEITGGELHVDDPVIVNEIRVGEAKVTHSALSAPAMPGGGGGRRF